MFTRLMWIVIITAVSRASRYDRSVIGTRRLPNSDPDMIWLDTEPEIPEHCRDQGLCEEVPNYPHEYIDHLLRNNATVRNALSFILGAYEIAKGCSEGHPKIDELCASTTVISHAKAAQDTNGRWFYLLPGQFMCLEKCVNDGGPCSNKAMYVFAGYKATCKQKVTRKRMVTVDRNGVVQYIDVDKILSGCCCQVAGV